MAKDYFKSLAHHVQVEVPRELDQRILQQFPGEIHQPFWKNLLSPVLVASLLVVLMGGWYFQRSYSTNQELAFLQKLDSLATFEGLELEGLSEQEWEILLAEESS